MSISLRNELDVIFNKDKEFDKVVARHLTDIKCSCLQQSPMVYDLIKNVNVPNPHYRTTADPSCPNCEGAGWIFEEYLLKTKYFFPPFRISHSQDFQYGITLSNITTFYFLPSENAQKIRIDDIIYLIDFDTDGKISLPVTRRQKWLVIDKYNNRLDNNKLEFLKVFAKPAPH